MQVKATFLATSLSLRQTAVARLRAASWVKLDRAAGGKYVEKSESDCSGRIYGTRSRYEGARGYRRAVSQAKKLRAPDPRIPEGSFRRTRHELGHGETRGELVRQGADAHRRGKPLVERRADGKRICPDRTRTFPREQRARRRDSLTSPKSISRRLPLGSARQIWIFRKPPRESNRFRFPRRFSCVDRMSVSCFLRRNNPCSYKIIPTTYQYLKVDRGMVNTKIKA